MASKINKKFALVVAGFIGAAALLVAAAIVVNVTYIQNADRHIRAGDELMAQGKVREAFQMYGRAVNKKPNEIRYIEKMEDALSKTVAQNAGQALEDYRSYVGLKRARTRAQPSDVAQWKMLLDCVDAESELYEQGNGWLNLETAAKEMKDVMAPGSPGMRLADETMLYARAQRERYLTPAERVDLDKALEAFLAQDPKSSRGWSALVDLRLSDAARLRDAGQDQASVRRTEQLDAAIAKMGKSLDAADPNAQYVIARAALERARFEAVAGSRLNRGKLDPKALAPLEAALAAAAPRTGSSRAVRDAAGMLLEDGNAEAEAALLDTWVKDHPEDLIAQAYRMEMRARAGTQDPVSWETLRADAQALLDKPQLPTGLVSNLQAGLRARALQLLIDTTVERLARESDADAKAKLVASLPPLRAKLVESEQNDEASPRVIAADAKIALANNDLAQAAAKWDQYFVKVPTPSPDAFVWAATTARLRGDLGLALQRATKGSEAHPGDLRLAVQRAELLAALGRFAESAALFDALARAMPDSKELAGMAADVAARAKSGAMPESGPEVRALQAAAEAKDWPKARSLAAEWVQRSKQSLQAIYAQAMLEYQAGDKKQAQAFAKKGLELFPQNMDLARLEALTTTDDPIERVQLVAERVIPDAAKRAPELQRAYSGMRDEITAKIAQAKVTNPPAVKALQDDLAKIDARLAELSKQVVAQSPDDPAVILSLFGDAMARRDFVAAQAQVAAAAKQKASPELEVVLRARLLDAQDKRAEAIALLEKARSQGRNESAVSATLAALVESSGNEPGAYALWKEAFERRPNDTMVARGWARAQARAGQGRNALEMMRSTAAANPNDVATQSQAALFEALYGSKARAVQLRMGMLRSAPGDRQNLAEIYALLHQPAEADSVVDDNGRPRFEARDWAAVPADEQRRLLDDAARRNEQLSESIYEAAIKDAPVDLLVPVAKARVMREQGTPEKGTAALQDLVKRAEASKQLNTGILLELAAHQLAIGDDAGLDATLARAAPLQDPVKREVDVATVEIEARRSHIDKAIAAQEKCLGEPPVMERLMRLADLQVVAKRYEDAERTIERIRTAAGAAPAVQLQRNIEMLAAGIAAGRAEQLSAAGKRDEARKQVTVALDALSKAITLAPSDYLAPLRRVQLLSGVARADGDMAMQAQAIAEADRLIARDAMLWPVVSARADLALGRNDIQAAIGFVEKFIQAQPSSEEGRGRLVDMFAQAGNLPRAIEVCRAGAELAPQNPAWPERLGDLLAQSGDFTGAAKQYDRAYVLAPKRLPLLAKAVDARLSGSQAADALSLLRTRNEQVSKSATLRAYAAVALSKIGRRDEAAVAARDALAAARNDPDAVTVTERTLQILRRMYRDGHVADLEALVSQGGQPAPIECIALSEEWGISGPAGFDKALAWADKALAGGDKVPANLRAGALMARGNALFSKGDAQAAVDAFAEAAKLAPTNPGALNNAAYLLAKVKGDYPQAVAMARRAVELAPGQPDFLDTLGYVELKSGKVAEAEDFLTKSVAVSPTASGLAHLAQVRIAQGKPGDAQVLLERARVKAVDDDTKKEIEEIAKSIKPSK